MATRDALTPGDTATAGLGHREPQRGLPRPQTARTSLATTALSAAERATLTATAAPIAVELLRVERVHASPVLQLNSGVSGTFAALEVDRVRRAARVALTGAAPDPV